MGEDSGVVEGGGNFVGLGSTSICAPLSLLSIGVDTQRFQFRVLFKARHSDVKTSGVMKRWRWYRKRGFEGKKRPGLVKQCDPVNQFSYLWRRLRTANERSPTIIIGQVRRSTLEADTATRIFR